MELGITEKVNFTRARIFKCRLQSLIASAHCVKFFNRRCNAALDYVTVSLSEKENKINVSVIKDNGRRVGVEEKFIRFRPSPNFKNMKKFLKSKIDSKENASPSSNSSPPNTTSPTPSFESKEKKDLIKPEVEKKRLKVVPIQPPLPLDPPPLDCPPKDIKKEIEELENELLDGVNSELENQNEEVKVEFKSDQIEERKVKKRPVCRDFLRGTCSRPGTCKYVHEYDISQLVGVYTFCRNYQNSKCTFPNCKYVHASVFEEQKFYRTGILPPHAMSHHKKVTVLPPPPPPPPEEPPKLDIPMDFSNPPPLLINGVNKVVPIMIAPPNANVEMRPPDVSAVTSPQKAVAHSPRDYDANELLAKTCSRCEWLEFSLHYNKDMVDKMIKTIEEDKNMMIQLTNKYQKLYTILLGFLKSTVKPPVLSTITSHDVTADKENHLLERLSKYFGGPNRMPMSDDTNKYIS